MLSELGSYNSSGCSRYVVMIPMPPVVSELNSKFDTRLALMTSVRLRGWTAPEMAIASRAPPRWYRCDGFLDRAPNGVHNPTSAVPAFSLNGKHGG